MRVILDTGVFYHPEALDMLRWYAAPVVVPVVVYAERRRQLAKANADLGEFDQLLDEMGVTLEAMGPTEATRFTSTLVDDRVWTRLARDSFIAGHVGPEDRLFTTNPRDFLELGLPETQVIEVPAWRARQQKKARVKKTP